MGKVLLRVLSKTPHLMERCSHSAKYKEYQEQMPVEQTTSHGGHGVKRQEGLAEDSALQKMFAFY